MTLLALTLGANAQQYRKSWDFTKWSTTTVANLQAEKAKGVDAAAWYDMEKKDGSATTNAIAENNCFFKTAAPASGGEILQANGENIAELDALTFIHTSGWAGLAIALNYPDCTPANGADFGPYHGASYLWLGSKNQNYCIIPHVELGTTIKMGIESHKFSSSRGVTLYVGHDNNGTKIADPIDADNNAVSDGNVTTYRDLTWQIPEDIEATNDDGTIDITVRCNSGGGCHIYYITVGDGDQPQVVDAKKVAYLYTGDLDSDFPYIMLAGSSDKFDVTAVNADTEAATLSLADLQQYDALVISPAITGFQEKVGTLVRSAIAYMPVVNLNATIYAELGLGKAVDSGTAIMTITDAQNAIFEGLEESIEYNDNITAVELGEYFAQDAVLAKAGDAVAIHTHNPGRNAYYYVTAVNAADDVYITLIPQVVLAAAKTKRDITAVGTPTITFVQEDGYSQVTISAANAKAIYYTTDGTVPTTASTLYAEPFTVNAECTVKAFAIGDGFTDSEIAEKVVTIAKRAKAPVFALSREAGATTVTLTTETEGVDIYYNFAGQNTTAASVKYTEPFVVTTPAKVTAFADAAEGLLASDIAEFFVGVDGINNRNIRWDVMSHFDANADDWKGKGQQTNDAGEIINANYFFTWGKNAGQYWDPESAEVGKASDGVTDSTYYTRTLAPETLDPGHGWMIKSIGQVMVWESLNLGYNIGDGSMRNPDTAEDAIGVNDSEGITMNAITFGKQPTDGPFNATLETTGKMTGPFDVVVYAGNGNEGETPTMQIETSADGQTWTKLGDVSYSLTKRNWKKTQLSYDGTDEVYVRLLHTAAKSSGQIYDIYVMYNGEKSQQYSDQTENGIANAQPQGNVVRTELFTIGGVRVSGKQSGLLIVRKTYADGTMKTQKVVR